MMTSPEPAVSRTWVAGLLEVDPSAERDAVRSAFLGKLADEDFVPPEVLRPGFELVQGRESENGRAILRYQFLEDTEGALREQIESFALAFFALSPEERVKRYHELREQAQLYPRLTARLKRLENGLELEAAECEGTDPDSSKLASCMCEALVLSPVAAAARWHDFLLECSDDLERWEAAAHRLQQSRPRLVALNPALVQKLLQRRGEKKRIAKLKQRAPMTSSTVGSSSSSSSSSSGGWGWWWVVFMIIGAVFRAASSSSTSSDQKNWPQPPPVPVPKTVFHETPNVGFQTEKDSNVDRSLKKIMERLKKQQEERRKPSLQNQKVPGEPKGPGVAPVKLPQPPPPPPPPSP